MSALPAMLATPLPSFEDDPIVRHALQPHPAWRTPLGDAGLAAVLQACRHGAGARAAWIGLPDGDELWLKARTEGVAERWPLTGSLSARALREPGTWLSAPDEHGATAPNGATLRWCTALRDAQGTAIGVLGVERVRTDDDTAPLLNALRCLAEVVLAQAVDAHQLNELALRDPLTGLGNRVHFDQALAGELAHAMRTGEPFAVLLLDLDGFKQVNDGFGHAAGDQVLCTVGQRLLEHARAGDALCRLGSDEFAIVMRHGGADAAQVLSQRIRRSVCAPIQLASGDEVGVGLSIGVGAYDDEVFSGPQLIERAEQSLFDNKRRNEQRWKCFIGER
jgi:diguanylate cyclase (GGDEF)-like protein